MKGKIVSIPLTNPEIGMQVMPYPSPSHVQHIMEVFDDNTVRVNDQADGLGFGRIREVSELKSIVVEYDEWGDQYVDNSIVGNCVDRKFKLTLPLQNSQWQEAMDKNLVDVKKKVEFEKALHDTANFKLKKGTPSSEFIYQAELTKEQPKFYTEDQVKEEIQKFLDDHQLERGMQIIGNEINDWWKKTHA